ncbi:DUF4221 family protein [Cyclobacterium sp. 1_MG-2023]|uniref:DUF4221 family protein n=1 Tax=Cyclobacterium sp. 1_MG-2023 TaxID=3062681 RepID=UPI0026E1B607|nr:DUF4221 family protein [Cyclobacterium sp. 1_MG-2023]MDO6438907.1 DUF4221 family protein [Cyclobacterium sp. 1_MG-2023]
MKSSFYCITLFIFFACNHSKSTSVSDPLPSLEISLDTVMIDPGDEILFLKLGLALSALSDNKNYLFNLDPRKNSIEQINLNTLSFEKKFIFEKEGPNGVDGYILGFSLINDEQLLFCTSQKISIFNWQAQKIKSTNIINLGKVSNQLEDGEWPFITVSISPEGNQFASLIFNYEEKTNALALINLDDETFRRLAVPTIEKAKKYEVTFKENGGGSGIVSTRYLKEGGGKILLGTSVSSEVYVLDKGSDTLRHLTFNSQLTPNEKKGTYPSEVGTLAELALFKRKIEEDINFKEPVWDEKKQVYYRLSYQLGFEDNFDQNENHVFPIPIGATVYLSVLDKNFNLIVEKKVPELSKNPSFHFAKDGKLWLFENIEDEMGFVRLDINW